MLKLHVKDMYAIYLDHRELIKLAYNECNNTNQSDTIELKQELFRFKIKTKTQSQTSSTKGSMTKNETPKRRRLEQSSTFVCANDPGIDIAQDNTKIHGNLMEYISLLQEKVIFPSATASEAEDAHKKCNDLPRYWEEPYSVLKVFGYNTSGTIQRWRQTNRDPQTYLIPKDCIFYNYPIEDYHEQNVADIIIIDPPWRNKYIRRLKRANPELAYPMLTNVQLAALPIAQYTRPGTLVAIWCTNSQQHQKALLELILPRWKLRLLHHLRWYKLNSYGYLINKFNKDLAKKQPYEMLYIACSGDSPTEYGLFMRKTELLLSVPCIIHSHKPPLLSWLRECWHAADPINHTRPNCLELFARYLQPNCTSVGMEVLKLMDTRLYNIKVEER